jgi:hypothetical protein
MSPPQKNRFGFGTADHVDIQAEMGYGIIHGLCFSERERIMKKNRVWLMA